MSTIDAAFAALSSRLEISPTEEQTASRRQQAIRAHVDKSWDIDRDFLMGSYRRATKTKPLKDVDIMLVLKSDGEQAHMRDEWPSKILSELHRALKDKYTAKIDGFGVTVSFSGENIASYEIVPAFERKEGGFWIPDADRSRWIATDPEAHQTASTDKNKDCGGKYVPFLKMIKAINRELGEPISPSFLIEVMAQELVDTPFGRYQDEIPWFLGSAAEQITDDWPDPAGVGPAVNELISTWDRQQAAQEIREWQRIAEEAGRLEDAGQERAAITEWQKLFGSRMPSS